MRRIGWAVALKGALSVVLLSTAASAQRVVSLQLPPSAIGVQGALGVRAISAAPSLSAGFAAAGAGLRLPSQPIAPLISVPAAPSVMGPASRAGVPSVGPTRALRLAIMGPPGVGKGTFGKRIASDYGVVHISVGELLRERAKADPAMAAVMQTGRLVDSAVVLAVVKERLARQDVLERGFLLDGFPRRLEEALALESWLGEKGKLDAVIHLNAPTAELERRILARGRADDNAKVFRDRMEIYRVETRPVLERLRRAVPILAPNVSGPDVELNWDNVSRELRQLSGR